MVLRWEKQQNAEFTKFSAVRTSSKHLLNSIFGIGPNLLSSDIWTICDDLFAQHKMPRIFIKCHDRRHDNSDRTLDVAVFGDHPKPCLGPRRLSFEPGTERTRKCLQGEHFERHPQSVFRVLWGCRGGGGSRRVPLVAQCSATPATVAATPPCSTTPFQTQISVRHLPARGGGRCDTKMFRGCSATPVLHLQNAIKSRRSAATRVVRHV